MGDHRVFTAFDSVTTGERVIVTGEEAQHAARVKRCAPGDPVELLNGRGLMATCRIEAVRKDPRSKGWELELLVGRAESVARPRVRLEVWSAVPKGGRLGEMIDQLSQVGACAWAPLHAQRSVAEPTAPKRARLERIAVESAKQCGRAWLLEFGAGGDLTAALREGSAIFADAGAGSVDAARPAGGNGGLVRILVGPEGGWTEGERRAAREAGAVFASFGPHAMRIETAAVAGAAIVLDRVRRAAPDQRERTAP